MVYETADKSSSLFEGTCPNQRHPCSNKGQYTTFIITETNEQKGTGFKHWFCQLCGEKWPKGNGLPWKRVKEL